MNWDDLPKADNIKASDHSSAMEDYLRVTELNIEENTILKGITYKFPLFILYISVWGIYTLSYTHKSMAW